MNCRVQEETFRTVGEVSNGIVNVRLSLRNATGSRKTLDRDG